MRKTGRFMIIDDDPLNNVLCKMVIRRMHSEVQIKLFNRPNLALDSIKEEYSKEGAYIPTILLLDINMPFMNGWDFLDEFRKLDYHIIKQFNVYIFTSSIDDNDKNKALADPLVIDFLSKPLNNDVLAKISKRQSLVSVHKRN